MSAATAVATDRRSWLVKTAPQGDVLRALVRAALASGLAAGAVVPRRRSATIVPTLVRDPAQIGGDSFFGAPIMPHNLANLLGELTFRPASGKIAAVLRSCEYRALVELTKLKQASLDAVMVIGIDCLGAAGPGKGAGVNAQQQPAGPDQAAWRARLAAADAAGQPGERSACAICLEPAGMGPGIVAGLVGVPAADGLLLTAPAGDEEAAKLVAALGDMEGVQVTASPAGSGAGSGAVAGAGAAAAAREQALAAVISAREAARAAVLGKWRAEEGNFAALAETLAACTGCLNCRRACPLCYCRECTFETALFDHEGQRYLSRAGRRGALRLPTEVMLYHLTRLAHVGLSCVSCGMCESYCPSDIPLTAMFAALGGEARKLFDYQPGRSPDEPLPLATFREEELAPR
ncbi:MAG: (Fe-S)-binding protein [Bacillota bacterium]|nr:(Fe-S)-binding protein [Bacillota bacterium]